MEQVESKDYSWKWVTADELLSHGVCELVYALLASDGQTAGKAILYDGENTSGDMIATIESVAQSATPFRPAKPVYCRRGLYITFTTGVGIFVQWRELGHRGEGG